MHTVVAVVVVIAATIASVAFVRWLYGAEVHHTAKRRVLVLMTLWFLVTYGLLAFAIDPRRN